MSVFELLAVIVCCLLVGWLAWLVCGPEEEREEEAVLDVLEVDR
jgi:hypothetical protein